jgi:hypothetical protein
MKTLKWKSNKKNRILGNKKRGDYSIVTLNLTIVDYISKNKKSRQTMSLTGFSVVQVKTGI